MLKFLITILIGFGLGLLTNLTRRNRSHMSGQQLERPQYFASSRESESSSSPEPEAIAEDIDFSVTHLAEIADLKAEIIALKQHNERLLSEKQSLHSECQQIHKDLDDFIEDYQPENQLKRLELENKKLEGQQTIAQRELSETKARLEKLQQENIEISAENKSLQSHINMLVSNPNMNNQKQIIHKTDVILRSTEKDFYPQEKYNILLKVLQEKFNNTRKKTRRFYLLQDILQHNHPTNYEDDFMSEIRAIFKGFTHFSPHQKQQLTQLGFELSEQGKHMKAIFKGDPRCQVSFSKSCSDKKRGGLNVITQIRRRLF